MSFNNVFVIADNQNAIGELCGGGRQLGSKVTAIVFGEKTCGETAIAFGADDAYVYSTGDGAVMIEDYAKPLSALLKEKGADLVLLNSSTRSRLLAGKIAAYLNTCVSAGISALVVDGDNATTERMIYGGAAFRTEKLQAETAVVTLGVGVFDALAEDTSRTGTVTEITDVPESKIKRVETREKNEVLVNLATAKRLVDLGRGFSQEEDLELGRKVASLIGADVGCTRPVAEGNGWMPKSSYIGVTGVILKPELCFVMGASGQVQHLVGINQSKTVVAINKDKKAPIFKHVDFGVVGDMYKILPALIERLSAL